MKAAELEAVKDMVKSVFERQNNFHMQTETLLNRWIFVPDLQRRKKER